jgi:hypothetical protein
VLSGRGERRLYTLADTVFPGTFFFVQRRHGDYGPASLLKAAAPACHIVVLSPFIVVLKSFTDVVVTYKMKPNSIRQIPTEMSHVSLFELFSKKEFKDLEDSIIYFSYIIILENISCISTMYYLLV